MAAPAPPSAAATPKAAAAGERPASPPRAGPRAVRGVGPLLLGLVAATVVVTLAPALPAPGPRSAGAPPAGQAVPVGEDSTSAGEEPSLPVRAVGRLTPRLDPVAGATLTAVSGLVPIGPRAARAAGLALTLCLALGAGASVLAWALLRGIGRGPAAACAGTVAPWLAALWLAELDPRALTAASAELLASTLGLLSVAAVVRARVHVGCLPSATVARSAVLAGAAALLEPWFGTVLAAMVGWSAIVHAPRRSSDLTHRRERGSSRPLRRIRGPATVALAGLLAVVVASHLARLGLAPAAADEFSLKLGPPPLAQLRAIAGAVVLALAASWLALLIAPLRWRGAGLLAVIAIAGTTVTVGAAPLMPTPLLLALISVCAGGWVWLAGSWAGPARGRGPSTPRTVARAAATAAAAVLLALVATTLPSRATDDELEATTAAEDASIDVPVRGRGRGSDATPAAGGWPTLRAWVQPRPHEPLARLLHRGLLLPGDVAILHDPALYELLRADQEEGARPDVELVGPVQARSTDVPLRMIQWASGGRRVLSDGFDLGGRIDPSWTLDAGPLFWFVGPQAAGSRGDPPDIVHFDPRARRSDQVSDAPWLRLHLERSRLRRALDDPSGAIIALPLTHDDVGALLLRVRLAREHGGTPGSTSELAPPTARDFATPRQRAARVLAEVGDTLYAAGDRDGGKAWLDDAAAAGCAAATEARARWQLRAGAGVEALAGGSLPGSTPNPAPDSPPRVAAIATWLASHGRATDALTLLSTTEQPQATGAEHPAAHVVARLATLAALATPSP